MANTYFRFKQFRIEQDQTAMKVSTDASILGAWFSQRLADGMDVLDIGSGTGLLMLMLAQRHALKLDGIEMDPRAYGQSLENVAASPWKDSIRIFSGDARNYEFSKKYDFIISNPPFFEQDLKSESQEKNMAKHSIELSLEELLQAIDTNLSPTGSFGLLLPYHRLESIETLAKSKKFFLREILMVRQTPEHEFFRVILHYTRIEQGKTQKGELIISDRNGDYTGPFVELMKDYYLYL